MKNEKSFMIRSYRTSDRTAVRRLCCQTGFLGDPIDPVYEDRQLFADFLTTYYTDHEPESCFLLASHCGINSTRFIKTFGSFFGRSPATFATISGRVALFAGRLCTAGGKCRRVHAVFRIFTSTCCRTPEEFRPHARS